MAEKTIYENPTILDDVVFEFVTPDDNGCLLSDPYKVDKLVVYFVERSFTDATLNQYEQVTYDQQKLEVSQAADKLACDFPTEDNILAAKRARVDLESSAVKQSFYYKEAVPVFTLGTPDFPAWLSTDVGNALIQKVDTDEEGNPWFGHFRYVWKTGSYREGDYFLCVTWTSVIAGEAKSSHQKFALHGDTSVTTTLPSHQTPSGKYQTLMERYTPEIFKTRMSDIDRTPDVLDKLNKSVADGFTVLENYANQIIDLFDANVLSEPLLPLLSNLFSLKLKSHDPFRWRRQIKQAIPLFKKKGTIGSVKESLAQAGIKFLKYTKLWQVISNHTWQEAFTYDGTSTDFSLARIALPVDLNNFELYIRLADSDTWTTLSSDYVMFNEVDNVTIMSWVGDSLSVSPIALGIGDTIRVIYKVADVMSPTEQNVEDYIRSLPLADSRDERDQDYPLKNWNVRLIEESDPLFDVVIPTKHPFHDDVVFGKVRTEFPYSENIYNMEEYNGSIRNSTDPCDIDKDFLDPCFSGLSSKYTIDLEIESISNDRIVEAHEVLKECMPFHAVLHTMNVYGGVTEIITPPSEYVEMLVGFGQAESVISGGAQMWFNRAMKGGLAGNAVLRNALASSSSVDSGTCTAYNDSIVLFSGEVNFEQVGLLQDNTSILRVMTGSLAGVYSLSNPSGNTVEVQTVAEPVDEAQSIFGPLLSLNTRAFTFRISNPVDAVSSTNIYQDNVYTFSDASESFETFKSLWDVSKGYATGSWTVKIPAYSPTPYNIINIMPDGTITLEDNGTLPGASVGSLSYTAYDQFGSTLFSSSTGSLSVSLRGRVEVLNSSLWDVRETLKVGYYQKISGTEYQIVGFVDGTNDQFYISGYSGGDVAGSTLDVYNRVVDGGVGYMSHAGLKMQVAGNLESSLGIGNGANSIATPLEDDHFMENYLVEIDGNLYLMAAINGNSPPGSTTVTLQGPDAYWQTLLSGGTSKSYTIYRYVKTQDVVIPGQQFDLPEVTFTTIDRRGREETSNTELPTPIMAAAVPAGDNFSDSVDQKEGVSFIIEYKDGGTEKGDL